MIMTVQTEFKVFTSVLFMLKDGEKFASLFLVFETLRNGTVSSLVTPIYLLFLEIV